MKTILVPTDFSPIANTALNYAIHVAGKLKSKIYLLHSYQVPAPIGEVPFAVLNDERRMLKEESEKNLLEASVKVGNAGIAYEYISVEGDAVDSILQAVKEKKAEMIIMGAKGETNLLDAIFGSVCLKVMEKASCPVMAIPNDTVITKPVKHITFATDYHQSDFAAIDRAVEIAGLSQAELNILHISDAEIGADEEKIMMRNFMEKVKKRSNYTKLSFQVIHGYKVEERLQQYVEDENTDMLMLSTHYRGFFDRIFGTSITKDIARNTNIPVLAFHHNANAAVKLI
ncbi:MAG: universal stress protein [Bacteroidia bacterium]|nr:universal stress protein [Bacteroidia bacterium]